MPSAPSSENIMEFIPKNIPNDKPHLIAVIVKGKRKTYLAFK